MGRWPSVLAVGVVALSRNRKKPRPISLPTPKPAAANALPTEGRIARGDSQVEVISQVYDVDRIYPSMTGPWSKQEVSFADSEAPELVWITGAHVEMIDRDGEKPMPELFMCHANLDMNVDKHRTLLDCSPSHDGRLFTLSQGQLEVKFPPGFGIPVLSNEPLELITQVLNLNFKDEQFQVRHRVVLDYVRDRDATQPMKPLYQGGVYGLKALVGKRDGLRCARERAVW